jgi:MFS family permease
MFVLGVLTGPLAARYGSKRVLVAGGVATIVPFVLLSLAHDRSWQIYLASSLMGIGMGLAFSSMSSIVVEAVPPVQTGVASGMNANIRTIGGAIGSSVAASILASGVTATHPFPSDSGYTSTFWFLAGAAVLAAVAALLIPTLRKGPADAGPQHRAVPEQAAENQPAGPEESTVA